MTDERYPHGSRHKGRGALFNPPSRYRSQVSEAVDDGWAREAQPPLRTTLGVDRSRSAISWNDSPDIPFDRAVNPYRGCEHGCIYCYARPTHAWLDLSPGLDFESRLFHRPELPELLRQELAAANYRPAPIVIGSITDAYQPVERTLGLTRQLLELLVECGHPFSIVTKSALVERDADLLAAAAATRIAEVAITVTTLRSGLARRMEPRAATPARRLETVRFLSDRGIPVRLMVAPLIPALTDPELEALLAAGKAAGAVAADYVLLRLPREVSPLFRQWLRDVAPEAYERVLQRLREAHGGRLYDSRFGHRLSGDSHYTDMLAQRFRLTCRRLGLADPPVLRCDRFRPPPAAGQLALF